MENSAQVGRMFYCFISHSAKTLEHSQAINSLMSRLNCYDYGIFYGGDKLMDEDDHVIHIDCDDTYEGLPNKIHNVCKYICNNSQFDLFSHFCKIDGTTPIESLIKVQSDQDYYGHIINQNNTTGNRHFHFRKCSPNSAWKNKLYPGIFIPYCVGGGYVLSKKSVSCIANQPDDPDHDIYEDLYVAQKLHNCNIHPLYYNIKQHLLNQRW